MSFRVATAAPQRNDPLTLIAQNQEAIIQFLSDKEDTTKQASTQTATLLHGPGGIFNVLGTDPTVISAYVRPFHPRREGPAPGVPLSGTVCAGSCSQGRSSPAPAPRGPTASPQLGQGPLQGRRSSPSRVFSSPRVIHR